MNVYAFLTVCTEDATCSGLQLHLTEMEAQSAMNKVIAQDIETLGRK